MNQVSNKVYKQHFLLLIILINKYFSKVAKNSETKIYIPGPPGPPGPAGPKVNLLEKYILSTIYSVLIFTYLRVIEVLPDQEEIR